MLSRRHLLLGVSSLCLAGIAGSASAERPPVFAPRGVAINGYDPVAYFTQRAPVAGSAAHSLMWKGSEWRFASAANRDAFAADPTAYAPQYGGYCAYAVSRGYTATTDPDAWRIHGGKLYLNHNRTVLRMWSRDIPGNISAGNANWPVVLDQ